MGKVLANAAGEGGVRLADPDRGSLHCAAVTQFNRRTDISEAKLAILDPL